MAACLLQQETLEGDELLRILTEAGALPADKVGLAAQQAREEAEAQGRQGA